MIKYVNHKEDSGRNLDGVSQKLMARHLGHIFLAFLAFSGVHGLKNYDPLSLDELVHNYAMEALAKQRTGTLAKVSLPHYLSGMDVSVVRLRSGSLWEKGANFSYFYLPPRVMTFPFVKRLSLVYQDFGDLSSNYYKLPDHFLVAPVVGFMAYDASNLSSLGNKTLKLRTMGDPILVHFPQIVNKKEGNAADFKCVKFGESGLVQFRNLTNENTCIAQGDGHFSIAVPMSLPKGRKKKKVWVWWVVGFGAGFMGLILVGVIGFSSYKILRRNRIRAMENESENGVGFETYGIGTSRMPIASMIRTQPAL